MHLTIQTSTHLLACPTLCVFGAIAFMNILPIQFDIVGMACVVQTGGAISPILQRGLRGSACASMRIGA